MINKRARRDMYDLHIYILILVHKYIYIYIYQALFLAPVISSVEEKPLVVSGFVGNRWFIKGLFFNNKNGSSYFFLRRAQEIMKKNWTFLHKELP